MLGPYRIVETDEEKERILRTELVHGTVFTRREWRRFCIVNLTLLVVLIFGAFGYLAKDMTPEQRAKALDFYWSLPVVR